MDKYTQKKQGLYEKYVKRGFDIVCSCLALFCFSWLYGIVAVLVRMKLGSPVLFIQLRPGMMDSETKSERIFKMYKFRSMTDERDENGELLPDEARMTSFGKWLRSTSLDELPEVFNILKGDMSILGPRPQLIRDMVFMTEEQRLRHTVRPGLSGLAQVNGRNNIDWEEKLEWDLKYIKKITFLGDLELIRQTVLKSFVKHEGITNGDMATAEDFGDYLLRRGKVSKNEYDRKQLEARRMYNALAAEHMDDGAKQERKIRRQEYPPFSVVMSVYGKDKANWFAQALDSVVNQTVKPDEIVLVVDGPIPEPIVQVIHEYRESCYLQGILFREVRLAQNQGLGNALKIAVEQCSNEMIARMDSDDIAVLTRFETQLQIMAENPDIDIVGGDIEEFTGDIQNKIGKRRVPATDAEIKEYMKKRCPFNHMTVMYRKSAVLKAGGYRNLYWNEDYFLWIRMAWQGCKMANTGTVLVNVRVGTDMYKRRGGRKYFESELYLQRYMLKRRMICGIVFAENICKRFTVQVLMPNQVRGWVFRKFAREKCR